LPPIVAPYQVVVVPIPSGDESTWSKVLEVARAIHQELRSSGVRSYLDDRVDMRPAEKYFEWELKGVPIRIEIGARELEKNIVTLFRRDEMKREVVERDRVVDRVRELMKEIGDKLRERAWRWFREHVKNFEKLEDALNFVRNGGGIAQVPWCGDDRCAAKVVDEAEGVAVLGCPLESIEKVEVFAPRCAICGAPATSIARIARRY